MLLYRENVREDKNTCLCFDNTDDIVLFLLSFILQAFSVIRSACRSNISRNENK